MKRVLVTSSRTPFALDMVRKLADRGHAVYASDTYEAAPGSHSRYLAGHFVTPAPDEDTARFVDEVERIVVDREVDVIVPSFEEAFFLATRHSRLSAATTLYTGRFEQLARLHDKSAFQRMASELGVATPETVLARSNDELREGIERFPRYFARAAFSRGGVSLLTNTGPLAGHMPIEDCHPTAESPWLVQEFVDGPMVCTYSTVHGGRVTAHCTYRAPRQWEHSTGISFRSVDGEASLRVVERIAGALDYTGQLSFDFVDGSGGLSIIECNPRTTDGALLMSADELAEGILEPGDATRLVEPGKEVELDFAVFGQMFSEGLKEVPGSVHDLLRVRGAGEGWRDMLPTLYSFLAFAHHERMSRREHEQLFAAMADDLCWNGGPIAGMSAEDAAVVGELQGERAA
jgi:glutathione synthase/RimK-type ligase-like ATP-grasp enzyme